MYWKYVIRRLLYGIGTFIAIIFIYSIIFNAKMETTVRAQIEEEIQVMKMGQTSSMTPQELSTWENELRARKYKEYSLDKSSGYRIVKRAYNVLTLKFGKSTHIRSSSGSTDVKAILGEVIPKTILLFTTVIIIDIFFALWLGIKKAQKAGSTMDQVTSLMTLIMQGIPGWWLGMIMILFFAYIFKIFPSGGFRSTPPPQGIMAIIDIIYHLILPVTTLFIIGFWGRAFLIRNIVLGILQEDYIMAARARGIAEKKVLFGHTMRSAAPPITTMALLSLLASIGGSIIFEGIFSWPGVGNLFWIAIEQNDIPVLMGSLFVTTSLYQGGLIFLDLIYGYLDPRIKVGGKS
ncbi:MAG: ABC transporter permease [Chitinivibrionales bacterium]|nr:ABC transporter permease [Chitinivibrionales bacterium]